MRSSMKGTLVASLLLPALCGPAAAQTMEKKVLTLEGARKVAAAAEADAKKNNAGGAIAIVDDGGHLVLLERLDNTFPSAAAVSIEKARTAATFRRATRDFEDAIKNGRTSLVAVSAMTPLQGGVPLVLDGQVIGAIGVSGAASAQQDEDIAKAAAGALAMAARSGGAGVAFHDHEKVAAAFAKGMPLLELDGYKVHASRRDTPGEAEVHVRDTDIVYVLEGAATLVTGGAVVDGRTAAPEEIRGSSIRGGEPRKLMRGDVVVVPNGVPHWFQQVDGPLLYYVVKVRS